MTLPRILHIVSKIDHYGASRQLRLLISGLQNKGWDNQVIALRTMGDAHQAIEAAGVPVVHLQQRWKIDPIAAARLAITLRRTPAELIHYWGLPAIAYSHAVNATHSKPPLLATLSSLQLASLSKNGGRLRRFALQRMTHRIDQLVVSNNATHQLCINARIDRKKLQVIPSGIPAASGRDARGATCSVETRLALLDELSLPKETRLVAVVGPLLAHKRVNDAIWCFELVRVLHENARMLIIGDGPLRRQLERFTRLVSVQVAEGDAVRFLGLRKDLADILPHIDVLWQRSDSHAATQHTAPRDPPNALLEAMAAGVPVVVTDIGAHRQVIEHGKTGFLSPLGGRADCTRFTDQILSDADLACRIGSAGQQHVREHYSLEQMIQAYEQLYKHWVEAKKGG